jgi:hypothetical protein
LLHWYIMEAKAWLGEAIGRHMSASGSERYPSRDAEYCPFKIHMVMVN